MGVKLDILNAMLAATGSASVVTATGNHPALLRARPLLDAENRSVQAQGHWFNTDWGLTLSPDSGGEFIVPQSTLKVDTTDSRSVFIRRGTRMYDPTTQTYVLPDTDTLDVDCVILLDYDDLPQSAIDYIKARAIMEIILAYDADQLTLAARANMTKVALLAFNTDRRSQRNITLRDNPTYARIMAGAFRHGSQPNPLYIGG